MTPELQSWWLYHFMAPFGPPHMIGRPPHGMRHFSPTISGSFVAVGVYVRTLTGIEGNVYQIL